MKSVVVLLFFLVIAPLLQAAPIAANASIDDVLDALDVRGRSLNDFSADVNVSLVDQTTGNTSSQSGKVLYQKLDGGDGRVRVDFTQRTDGNRIMDEHHEYTLAGGWLNERDYQKKTELRRQVVRPGQKLDLLKLGEGPFPLPVGQKKEDVHRQFDVTLVPPDKSDPANSVHLTLKPKADTDMARRFSQVDVYADRQSCMPVRIVTLDAAGQQATTTDLSNIQLNVGLADKDFSLPAVQGWDTTEEPYKG